MELAREEARGGKRQPFAGVSKQAGRGGQGVFDRLYKAWQAGVCRTKGGKEQFTLRRLDMDGQVWPVEPMVASCSANTLCKVGQAGFVWDQRRPTAVSKRLRSRASEAVWNQRVRAAVPNPGKEDVSVSSGTKSVQRQFQNLYSRFRFLGPGLGPSGATSAQQQFQDLQQI